MGRNIYFDFGEKKSCDTFVYICKE
jgi:hypothetical protein